MQTARTDADSLGEIKVHKLALRGAQKVSNEVTIGFATRLHK
jgi:hypothetical protein